MCVCIRGERQAFDQNILFGSGIAILMIGKCEAVIKSRVGRISRRTVLPDCQCRFMIIRIPISAAERIPGLRGKRIFAARNPKQADGFGIVCCVIRRQPCLLPKIAAPDQMHRRRFKEPRRIIIFFPGQRGLSGMQIGISRINHRADHRDCDQQ